MPQDALLKTFEEDAITQGNSIINDAEEAAKEMMKAAEEEALESGEDRKKELAISLERKRAAALNGARTHAAGDKLRTRHEILEDTFKEALESLAALPKQQYSEILNGLYFELKSEWEKNAGLGRPVVLLNPDDAALLKDKAANIRPDKEVSLGIIFTSEDGRARFENTLPSRIGKAKSGLVPALNRLLFG